MEDTFEHLPVPHNVALDGAAAELASKLFALTADLEIILERRKHRFDSELQSFVDGIEKRKKTLSFEARTVSTTVDEDRVEPGLYTYLLGLFGYERRVYERREVRTKQLNMKEVVAQLEKFIADTRADYEKQVMKIFDLDSLVREAMEGTTDALRHEELAILKVALRRSFSKMAIKPLHARHDMTVTEPMLQDAEEIEKACARAEKNLDRICRSLTARANLARRSVDRTMTKIIEGVSEEFISACVVRKRLENVLKMAVAQENPAMGMGQILTIQKGSTETAEPIVHDV